MWVELGRGAYDHSGHSGGGGPDRRTTLMKRAQFGTEQVRWSCMMGSCTLDLPRIHHHIGLKKCLNSSDCCLLALAQKQKRTEPFPWAEKVCTMYLTKGASKTASLALPLTPSLRSTLHPSIHPLTTVFAYVCWRQPGEGLGRTQQSKGERGESRYVLETKSARSFETRRFMSPDSRLITFALSWD